ncbi:MAG: T9SS type A sorting domain-containing protein [Bacteroidetes bacterium]|nr:T9SS type A sorting domain-containing protein [Bacteroidota bacterium]
MKYKLLIFVSFCLTYSNAQFAPQVGYPGCLAINKDSSLFINWAKSCSVNRGWQNIADTILGKTDAGTEEMVAGMPGNGVVSLGDGGIATITFNQAIKNGPGYDFAVFENGFPFGNSSFFLELAFVEVSSDGIHFVRFNATSNTDTLHQIDQTIGIDASKIHNLAGKYIANYGTPFDLDEFLPLSNIDINHITHIRIIDVVGSIDNNFAQRDSRGYTINDPWPTPFASSGFDLDAIGVIHQIESTGIKNPQLNLLTNFKNPVNSNENIHLNFGNYQNEGTLKICDFMGSFVYETKKELGQQDLIYNISNIGVYVLMFESLDGIFKQKIIVKE